MTDAADLSPRHRPEALAFLLERRSTPAKTLRRPGPDDTTLRTLLTAAARTPDHGKLVPWRFLIIRDAAQTALAEAAAARAAMIGQDVEKARRTFLDGALIVAVVASPKPSEKIPEIEQLMSAGAACLALLNAALASGWGANWLSGWAAHDREFGVSALGLTTQESVAGFVHIGVPSAAPPERPRPALDDVVSTLDPAVINTPT